MNVQNNPGTALYEQSQAKEKKGGMDASPHLKEVC